MRGMIRTLALGAVLAAGVATGAMAQGINNTGYDRSYYGDPGYYGNRGGYYGGTYYDRQPYSGYRYAPGPNYGTGPGDNYGSSSPYGTGWWDNRNGPAQQAPWGYGGEYGYNAGFRSPSKY
jgi:hypothetical protein